MKKQTASKTEAKAKLMKRIAWLRGEVARMEAELQAWRTNPVRTCFNNVGTGDRVRAIRLTKEALTKREAELKAL